MREYQIQDRRRLDAALGAERFLLFKHSPRCPFSARAFRVYAAFVQAHPEVPHGWIDVVDHGDWSAWIAEQAGVRHASPQALLVRGGRVSWHCNHRGITEAALSEAIDD